MDNPIIVYEVATGNILGYGFILQPKLSDGQAVEDYKGPTLSGRFDFLRRTGPSQVVQKSQDEINTILQADQKQAQQKQSDPIRAVILNSFGEKFTADDLAVASKELDVLCAQAPTLNAIVRFFVNKIQGQ